MTIRSLIHSILLLLAVSCTPVKTHAPATQPTAKPERAGIAVYVGDELLTDYNPKSSLVTKRTTITKPKFDVIDIHCHWTMQQDPAALLKAMDDLGETKAVNLSGGSGQKLYDTLAKFSNAAPKRLIIFANVDWKRIDDPNFSPAAVEELRSASRAGARGFKVFKDLGLTVKDKSGATVPIDDPRIDPIWDVCAELNWPVLIHSGDPTAFFQPLDAHNERWMQLKRHPDWSFYGPSFPSHAEVLGQFIRMVKKHPKTVFIAAHLANSGENLEQLSKWLDECPNLYTDISGRVPELGRQPYAARKFLIKYADRILFGTDRYPGRLDQQRNLIYYRFLETDDEYFNYYDHTFPTEGEWKVYGVYLPDDVLKKIYHENAERALAGKMPVK